MKKYCVISHTHWDREWYQTQEQFRLRLVDLVDHVLEILEEDPDFIFHMDGQTIVMEDYFEIKPENRELCKKYIREGRFLIGPWYVQNDFFLTSGEATVRNLLLGIRQAEELGGCMRIGYMPDQFGMTSQMPQILRGFDIDTGILGRGYHGMYVAEDQTVVEHMLPSEFRWKSPDGSEVLGICMSFWYNNAQRFSDNIDRAVALVRWNEKKFTGVATTPYILMMNGCDHIEAQENLKEILKKVQKQLRPDEQILQTSMEQYIGLVKSSLCTQKLLAREGELTEGSDEHTLKDTSSSRVYLKQQNAELQNLLANRLEPLYTMLEMSRMAGVYPAGHLDFQWKMLIKNHAHDSICGCSKDAVHRHMEDRFAAVLEAGEGLLVRGMTLLADHIDRNQMRKEDYLLTVVNTLDFARTEIINTTVDIVRSDDRGGIVLLDVAGREVPFILKKREPINKRVISPINLPGFLEVWRYHICFAAEEIPAFGYQAYRVKAAADGVDHSGGASKGQTQEVYVLENRYLRADILADGTLHLFHKESGHQYSDVFTLEDTADLGEAYISKPLEGDVPVSLCGFIPEISWVEQSQFCSSVQLAYKLMLPEKYDAKQKSRSEKTCICPVTIRLSLGQEDRYLSITVDVENHAKDHRLRAVISTGLDSAVTQAQMPYDLVEHNKEEIDTRICNETRRNDGLVTITKDGIGLSVLNKGLYSYENWKDRSGVLALTLVRATGRINEMGEGFPEDDSWEVPENQCLRNLKLELALYPHRGDAVASKAQNMSLAFQNPLLALDTAVDTKKFLGGRPALQDDNLGESFYREDPYPEVHLSLCGSSISVAGGAFQVTALKKAWDRNGYILRFYNAAKQKGIAYVSFGELPVCRVTRTNLEEKEMECCELTNHGVTLQVKAKEIVTLRIEIK